MSKGSEHVNDRDATFSNTSRIGAKRSNHWFVDAAGPELFLNKKQSIQMANSKLSSGIPYACTPWENTSSFQSSPNPFIGPLFGSETARSVNFAERNISSVEMDNLNFRRKDTENQYNSNRENNRDLPTGQALDRVNETGFLSVGKANNKEHDNVILTGQSYNRVDAHLRSASSNYGRGEENTISIIDTYSKGDANIMSFDGFPDEQDIISIGRPVDSYGQLYHQSSQTSETVCEKELDAANDKAVVKNHVVKPRPESVSKNKQECKLSRKEAPNSFPSNVRSLISTGMLDGVPVKYVSLTQEELRGIIKGSGYLCGCQSCNFSKVLNAYEFERHAGCKTKHPNNHIYFENGKTIYQIVQELRSTPESSLFDTIQTVFGAPINQKSFRIWKESYQAATRELHRIYGKEELNL
ncbi:hypothetical protein FNV43_RR04271 [Rhamnella rubrinervis]|uniref:Tify domain-containing protein n=1 Tax=Rhamnella rubrinervis TaxID=2594499 RepID=A0A8K0MQF6_9ROSA|nr:hypothetical protein FNV43_RR04271 [Rhamnella rubrinervis]